MMAQGDAGQDPRALAAQRLGNRGLKVDYELLRKIRVPTLVIYGALDNPSRFDTLKSVMPDAEFVAVEGARHGDTPSNPQFIKDVRQFLARHAARH